ncbi:LysR family transcriptional regulator [Thalassotalea euphylliae]|uniref:LysR family transcriptional regulator n=1 Tax=Thalassotalea euphylliae TaxID=1655234 RepID=A0A3E0U276_9GAMM|nr:LysR substrate-binding domain-containing protein [Thalassotalea euphylliae]REL30839.1 LysR family transcriptional regulator [Thalassotalea euphylliae]
MNKLRHMSIFAQIVESGSITEAAALLQLSKSVVSQHLSALENDLGVLLIKRTTRRHTLTAAGRAFYQSCQEVNKLTDHAWQQAQESLTSPKGQVRITAPNALMDIIIAPAIGELLRQYPLLKPELISGDKPFDLVAENIDIAIRVGSSLASNIKQRRIGQFRDVLCGSKALLRETDITHAKYIANHWQGQQIEHRFIDKNGKKESFEVTAHCRANSFYTCLTLLKQVAGIGLIPDFHFYQLASQLEEVFPNLQLATNNVYALHTYDKHLPASIKVCIEAIEQQLNRCYSAGDH